MTFRDWMAARGQGLATFVAATQNVSKRTVAWAQETTKAAGESIDAFKEGYQQKRLEVLTDGTAPKENNTKGQ